MTDQSKITGPGRSLFDRDEDVWGADDLRAAPVPSELVRPVNRQAPKRAERPVSAPQPRAPQRTTEADAAVPVTEDKAPLRRSGHIEPIDREQLQRAGLIQPEGQVTGLLEEFRIVKRQVLNSVRKAREAGKGARAQRVLVCSPLPAEGKTFCAANLALAMAAEKDSEVLLVDADFAKPSILSTLGLSSSLGLMDVLANPDVHLEDCIIETDIAGLLVLPAGNQTNSDSEFLASARTAQILDRLTAGEPNRIVIFDSPPALAASPAAELARHVGQAIVVTRADRTGQSALEDALTLLSACPDIKLLLNAAHFSPSGRRFGTYYGQEE
ncbi:AAA family ATPase [Aurantiacibacter suaedae]|uniref:AAA family ATPase n=1 Tax=Aurantiacibacter suaedae TaxID=2545755 RepID=UPI0010F54B8A|nr:AAA family ATPase [Aurantiacibacter suaedae]